MIQYQNGTVPHALNLRYMHEIGKLVEQERAMIEDTLDTMQVKVIGPEIGLF